MTKIFKKTAAVIVVAAMLLSCLAFNGMAAGTPTGTEAMDIGLALSSSDVAEGDIVTVTINISNNYNAITMRWPVLYSRAFFELVGTDGGITTPIDSFTAVAGSTTTTSNASFVPAAYGTETYDAFTIQWIAGGNTTDGVGVYNQATAHTCFTFQLRVKTGATGTGTVFIPSDSTSFYYTGITNPMDATTAYSVTTPFTFTFSDAQTASIAVAADPVLVAQEGFDVQTITFDGDENTYLVGFDCEAIIDNGGDFRDQFTVTNGTYTVSSETFGTGVTVSVYDLSDNLYATYTIIMFGDLNGDGLVDSMDLADCIFAYNYEIELTGAPLYAADIYVADSSYAEIDSMDLSNFVYFINYEITWAEISQTHTAAL